MTTENSDFDVGEFYDEGVQNAGISEEDAVTDSPKQEDSSAMTRQGAEEQAETEKEEKIVEEKAADSSSAEEINAALESTKEEEPESVIGALLPKVEDIEKAQRMKPGQFVPVEDHAKLRESRREEREARIRAEQERDELRKKLEATSTGGEKPGKSPLEKFVEENPDEDFVPAKVQLEERRYQDALRQAETEARNRKEQERLQEQQQAKERADSIKALGQKLLDTESVLRKQENSDYDAVTKPVVDAGLLSPTEKIEILKAENPAQRLYQICKAKKEALSGIFGKPSETPKESKSADKASAKTPKGAKAEEDMTDDEIFEEVFGKPDY